MGRVGGWRENQLIDWIAQYSGRQKGNMICGIGDDAAVYQPTPGEVSLVTCDAMVEDVHWSFQWCDPASLGYKAAAVNLSDMAAMGGVPQRAFLTLGVPPRMDGVQLKKTVKALIDALHDHHVTLAGGDTVASPAGMMITLTLQGSAPAQQVLLRKKAKPNDLIVVTGTLGDAAAGLAILKSLPQSAGQYRSLVRKLLRPVPLVREARTLAQSGQVHAMMDLSDGLAADLPKLLKASRVSARIYKAQLPVSSGVLKAARALQTDPRHWALSGGEDYQLLLTASPKHAYSLINLLRTKHRTPATIIGEILPARMGTIMIDESGQKSKLPMGWEHRGFKH